MDHLEIILIAIQAGCLLGIIGVVAIPYYRCKTHIERRTTSKGI